MSFASFPALTASGISRCRIRIDIEAPEIILFLQLYLLSEEEEKGEKEGEEKVFDEAPVQVMKEPGKINNDSGWCQDEPANHVGPGGGGGEVTR